MRARATASGICILRLPSIDLDRAAGQTSILLATSRSDSRLSFIKSIKYRLLTGTIELLLMCPRLLDMAYFAK